MLVPQKFPFLFLSLPSTSDDYDCLGLILSSLGLKNQYTLGRHVLVVPSIGQLDLKGQYDDYLKPLQFQSRVFCAHQLVKYVSYCLSDLTPFSFANQLATFSQTKALVKWFVKAATISYVTSCKQIRARFGLCQVENQMMFKRGFLRLQTASHNKFSLVIHQCVHMHM